MQKEYDFVIVQTVEISGHDIGPDGFKEGHYFHRKVTICEVHSDLPMAQKAIESHSDSEKKSRCRFVGTTFTVQMFPKGKVVAGEVVSEEGA